MTLAYKTLINEETREEYDDYLDSVGSSRSRQKEEGLDPEEIERRKRERGKKRYEEDYDFANEEFYNMFKERTKGKGQGAKSGENSKETEEDVNDMNFNGKDINMTLDVNIEDSLFNQTIQEKTIKFMKNVICTSCNGSRNVDGEKGSLCYSCNGTGIRKDPLFHKESKCNTCKGFGYLVKDACKTC